MAEVENFNNFSTVINKWSQLVDNELTNLNFTFEFYSIKIFEISKQISGNLSNKRSFEIPFNNLSLNKEHLASFFLSHFNFTNEKDIDHINNLFESTDNLAIENNVENHVVSLITECLKEIPTNFSDRLAEAFILYFHINVVNKLANKYPKYKEFYFSFNEAIFNKQLVRKAINLFTSTQDEIKLLTHLNMFFEYYFSEIKLWCLNLQSWCNQLIRLNSDFASLSTFQKNRFNFWLNQGYKYFDMNMLLNLTDLQKDIVLQLVFNSNLVLKDISENYEIEIEELEKDIFVLENNRILYLNNIDGISFVSFNFYISKKPTKFVNKLNRL